MDGNGRPTLPTEIIGRILCFLSPRDVVRLRVVSRQFHDISHLPHIWKTLYANARLPRPPGPFPSQSVQFLQRTLVKSERLAHSWINRPMRGISCMEIEPHYFTTFERPEVVDGRWLIDCEWSRRFVVYDIDSDSAPVTRQVLYEQDQSIIGWGTASLTSIDGPVVYIVFDVEIRGSSSLHSRKLLEFRVSDTSGQLCHLWSLDIPMSKFVIRYLYDGRGPFLYLKGHHLILNADTRELYRFPPLGSALGGLPPDWHFEPLADVHTLISKTHVIFCRSVIHGSTLAVRSMLVQAFMLPPDPSPVAGDLPLMHLSHEGFINTHFRDIIIIRNSVVDPTTGQTNIRLLNQWFAEGGSLHFSCIDLTLPKHPPAETSMVLPMNIVVQEVLVVECGLDNPHYEWTYHIDASEDGYARGIWHTGVLSHWPLKHRPVLRFAIDASQDKCTVVVGERSRPQGVRMDHLHPTGFLELNCAIGRWLYIDRRELKNEEDSRAALAFDII